MMKSRKFFGITVLVLLVALAIYYLKSNISEFSELRIVNAWYILPLIFLFILSYWFIGFVLKILLNPFGADLTLKESFMISIVTGFYNLITPFRGGMVARGVYLKKKHNFSYTNFFATLAASYIIIFLISSFIGLISVYLIFIIYGVFNLIIFFIFTLMFFGMLIIVLIAPELSERKNKLINKLTKIINGWHLVKTKKKVVLWVGFISAIQILLGAFMLYLQFKVFGFEISYLKSLFLSCIGNLGILIAITPANLGISEAITVFSALTLRITPAESLSAALLGRVVSFVVLFILGPIFSYFLLRKKSI